MQGTGASAPPRGAGLVDDFGAANARFELHRHGPALFEFKVSDAMTCMTLRLWTSRIGSIDAVLRLDTDGPVTRLDGPNELLAVDEAGALQRLSMDAGHVHFERMDRGYMWLGLHRERDDARVDIDFHTRGYVKLKLVSDRHRPGAVDDSHGS